MVRKKRVWNYVYMSEQNKINMQDLNLVFRELALNILKTTAPPTIPATHKDDNAL